MRARVNGENEFVVYVLSMINKMMLAKSTWIYFKKACTKQNTHSPDHSESF